MRALEVGQLALARGLVLLRPNDAGELSAGGVMLPDASRERPRRGEVVAVGPAVRDVRVGDDVLWARFADADLRVGGEHLALVHETDVIGRYA